MIDIRLLQYDEMDQAAALCDNIFRDEEHISMRTAFPLVFSRLQQSYGAFLHGELVSFMGLVPSVIKIGPAELNVFSLGAVCTHPDHQGNGYAGEVLGRVMEHVERSDAALLLVSGGGPLYTRNGCWPYGAVYTHYLNAASVGSEAGAGNGAHGYTFREMSSTDWLKWRAVAASRNVRFEQSVWDLAALLHGEASASNRKQHYRMLVAEREGRFAAFAVVGIPYRPGVHHTSGVYEWGGDEQAIAGLLAYAVNHYSLHELEIPLSWYEQPLMEVMGPLSFRIRKVGSDTVKIIHSERLIDQLRPYLQEKNAGLSGQFTIKQWNNDTSEISVLGCGLKVSHKDLVSLLFNAESELDVPGEMKDALGDLFPVPFPQTHGLNYV